MKLLELLFLFCLLVLSSVKAGLMRYVLGPGSLKQPLLPTLSGSTTGGDKGHLPPPPPKKKDIFSSPVCPKIIQNLKISPNLTISA